jgi:tetratricopeptide (TPR) repeat protein
MTREQRVEQLKSFLEDDPGDPFTRFALAQEYRAMGRTDQALEMFEALVEDRPDYVGTYYHLGKLYEQLDRKDDALLTYETGIEVAEEQDDLHARSELQDARMNAKGIGFDEEE